MLGTLGRNAAPLAVVTASARNAPDSNCPTDSGPLLNDIGICPPRRSLMEGAPPLYGTAFKSIFARFFKSSPARCVDVPVPACANDRLPGLALAAEIISPSVLKGES